MNNILDRDKAEMIGDENNIVTPEKGIVDIVLSETTVRDYVCSVCWGHLIRRRYDLTSDIVECGVYGPLHSGYVTKFWVERQRQADQNNSAEAKDMLRTIGIIRNEHEGKSEKQLLDELGF